MTPPRSEWRGRADFAEIAEAIGHATDAIMAVYLDGKAIIVAFSGPDDGDDAWLVRLRRRNSDGILEPLPEPPQHMPGMVAQLRAGMLRKGGPQ